MTREKVKLGFSGWMITGIVLTILGGIYTAIGGSCTAALWNQEERLIGVVFLGIGLLFLIAGVSCLSVWIRRKHRIQKMLDAGRYVWAEVIDIVPNFGVQVNGRCVYNVMARYTDMYGTKHLFKSPNQRIIRDPDLFGRKVKVYIEDETYGFYYVDVSGLMDNVIEH